MPRYKNTQRDRSDYDVCAPVGGGCGTGPSIRSAPKNLLGHCVWGRPRDKAEKMETWCQSAGMKCLQGYNSTHTHTHRTQTASVDVNLTETGRLN